MSEADTSSGAGATSADTAAGAAGPNGATAARPGGAGFRWRDSVGFLVDESDSRWEDEEEKEQLTRIQTAATTKDTEPNRPDEEENPGNLGLIMRGYSEQQQPRVIEGSPFVTPTVPLKLRRAVYTNDMETVRTMINRWNSADTSGDSDADSVKRRYATATFDEHSRDTLLHVAVRKQYVEMVRYLVSQGARRNAVNRRDQTPLGIAQTMLQALENWDDYPIAMKVSGHPNVGVDGVYTQRGEHAGFPRYANQHGMHLWHNQPGGAWLIHVEFTPDSDLCLAGFGGSPKAVPAGTSPHQWICAVGTKQAAKDAKAVLEEFRQRIVATHEHAEKVRVEEERDCYLRRLESTGGRYTERVLTITQLDEIELRNAVENTVHNVRGDSQGEKATAHLDQGKSGTHVRERTPRLPGLTLSERRKTGKVARARTLATIKALRGCFAQFQSSNFAAGDAPWSAPESAWAGGPPEGEPHPTWADDDNVTTKRVQMENPGEKKLYTRLTVVTEGQDCKADCTAKPGGWPDAMKHKMEKGNRKPVRVAGLPGLLPPETPGWSPPRDKVLQRPMKARIAKAHSTPKKWASVNHTVRSQIGQRHAQTYEALVGSIKERKRTPKWLQGMERGFHRAHKAIPVETRGVGWK